MALKIDENAKTLQTVLKEFGGTKSILEGFNHFIRARLPEILLKTNYSVVAGDTVINGRLRNILISRPIITSDNDGPSKMYPQWVRRFGTSYLATISAEFHLSVVNRDGSESSYGDPIDVELGKIPVMVRSEICNTYKMPKQALAAIGETHLDHGGYFIIEQSQKVLMIQERLLTNKFLLYVKHSSIDGKGMFPTVTFTSTVVGKGTTLVDVVEHKKIVSVNMIGDSNKRFQTNIIHVSAILISYLYDITDLSDIANKYFEIFNTFINGDKARDRKKHAYIHMIATTTAFKAKESLSEIVKSVVESIGTKFTTSVYNTVVQQDQDSYALSSLTLWLSHSLFKNILYEPTMTDDQADYAIKMKLRSLIYMSVKIVEYKLGIRPLDDQDGWENKMLMVAGGHYEAQFVRMWKAQEVTIPSLQVDEVKKFFITNGSGMTKEFIKAFTSGVWGVPRSPTTKSLVIVANLAIDSMIASISHGLKVIVPSTKQSTIRNKRLVQGSQYNVICPATTPEGGSCGLTKALALTTFPSLERKTNAVHRIVMREVSKDQTESRSHPAFLNGAHMGYCDGETLRSAVISARRKMRIQLDISVTFTNQKEVFVYSSAGRPTAPYLIVDSEGDLVIDKKGLREARLKTLMSEGALEYLDVMEVLQHAYIADDPAKVSIAKNRIKEARSLTDYYRVQIESETPGSTKFIEIQKDFDKAAESLETLAGLHKYTHSLIDQNSLFSTQVSIIPAANKMQGPRVTYQASMCAQAVCRDFGNFTNVHNTTARFAAETDLPLFTTNGHAELGLDDAPAGNMVIFAIATFGGANQEDGIIINRASLELGKFRSFHLMSVSCTFVNQMKSTESSALPERAGQDKRYRNLVYNEENGIYTVRVGSHVVKGDCLVAKLTSPTSNDPNARPVDTSLYAEVGKSGVISEVLFTHDSKCHRLVRIKIKQERTPQVGDKFASRYAQKGVEALAVNKEDMPYIASANKRLNGVTPDIIFNPHGIPSRMTMGKLEEVIASVYAADTGTRVNATSYKNYDMEMMQQHLKSRGFSYDGKYTMIDGITGEEIQTEIFIGGSYYQRLKHMVQDKMQGRGPIGSISAITKQGLPGIRKEGALRFGEMERNCALARGASAFAVGQLKYASDPHLVIGCTACGGIGNVNLNDGNFACTVCHKVGTVKYKMVVPYTSIVFSPSQLAHAGIKQIFSIREKRM